MKKTYTPQDILSTTLRSSLIPLNEQEGFSRTSPSKETPPLQEIKLTLELPKEEIEIEKYRVSLFELAQEIISKMWFVILVGFLFFTVAFGIVYWNEMNNAPHSGVSQSMIMFGFPEAELGLNPLGAPLDTQVIRSPHIIGQALDSLDLRARGISPEDVRSNLVIHAVQAHEQISRLDLIQATIASGERLLELIDDLVYHPTQFVLTLYRAGTLQNLTDYEMSAFLRALIYYYTEDFIATYNELSFLNTIVTHLPLEDHDFMELSQILGIAILNMSAHLHLLVYDFPDFRSANTSHTFGEILAQLNILNSINFAALNADIEINSLSRDRRRAADVLEHRVAVLSLEEQVLRQNAAHAIWLASEVYTPETWLIEFHSSDVQEMFRQDTVYNEFLMRAQNYTAEANQVAADILGYERSIQAFRYGSDPSPAVVRRVENDITDLFTRISNLELMTNQTIQDLIVYDLYRDAVRTVMPPIFTHHSGVSTLLVMMSALVAGFVGLVVGVLVIVYRRVFA